MSSYFTQFKTLWDEFANYQPFIVGTCACICGSKLSQSDAEHKEHVFRFLMGLNDNYGNIIGQILLLEHFPSISKVRSLILQEEKRSTSHSFNMVQPVDAIAMYANNNKGFHGNQGHNHGYHGGKGGNSKKERPICTYCGLTSHIADKCYKLNGYPPSYKPKGGNKAMSNQISAILHTGNFGLDAGNTEWCFVYCWCSI